MNAHRFGAFAAHVAARRLSRRQALRVGGAGLAVTALAPWLVGDAAAQGATPAATPLATPLATPSGSAALSDATLWAFEADVAAAMQTFQVPGAAVALVQGNRVAYVGGFGVRDFEGTAPVTPRTRFRIGSNTKSMTSLLVATFVDQGVLGWETPAVDVWPEFRAPTPELTQDLRVRDLLGMGSGIAEATTIEFFMSGGGESARDLLRAVAYLPAIGPPDTAYAYNNTLVCAAGYLASIAEGTALDALEVAYATLIRQRLFAPIGMADAVIADDPRPLGGDYAVGSTRDLFGRPSAVPFVSIDGVAPAGAALASATDMARYLITQMNGGLTPEGTRIVSAANLAETHQPGIVVLPDALNGLPSLLLPDTTAMHYCMGWFDQTFTDGRRLLWHAGGIDGFASLMGFFPVEQLGFVLLTNLEPGRGGALFNVSVQSSLLSRLFGLNRELPAVLAGVVPAVDKQFADLAAQTRPVDPAAVAPYLGLYEDGFRLRLDAAGVLRLDHDIRSLPLLALPAGTYVVADGPSVILQKEVSFAADAGGVPTMTIDGFDPVRWLTGG